MNKTVLLFTSIIMSFSCFSQVGDNNSHPYMNPNISIEERIRDLMERLTVDEKTDLLLYNSPAIDRLDIPAYNWWNECLHGVARAGRATVFPQVIGMAASFDPELIYEVGVAVSDEARAKHHDALSRGSSIQYTGLTFWTPNINIFRDPRWGRGQETYGEDPFLTASLSAAYVRGLQGDHPVYLKTAACAKHFAVGSGPESIRHHVNAKPPISDFYNTYLPAFKALVDADVEAVMCAYNRLYDAPCCGSTALLKNLLREEWGFQGHIVSDCWALDDIWLRHKTVETRTEAAVMSAKAGVNVNCGYVYSYLDTAYAQGDISEEQINELLIPGLRTRFKLGEFDPSEGNPYANISTDVVNCDTHRMLAYEAAKKSIVLLQNKNQVLPLNAKKINNLMVTGPLAADPALLMGNYNGLSGDFVSILEGITRQADPGMVISYSPGTTLHQSERYHGIWQAQAVDAAIVVLGYSYLLEGEDGDAMLTDHGGDRPDLKLPENQLELLRKIREALKDKPLVVMIGAGSAVKMSEVLELADAVLMIWYPGEQGGNAAADILFGHANPSAKLPISFYKSVEDLPAFDDYSMQNRTYRYFSEELQFPFGFGLSYSAFQFNTLKSDRKVYTTQDSIHISVSLSNLSAVDGDEVVQIYASRNGRSIDEPLKSLIGYKRLTVKAGHTEIVDLSIAMDRFLLYDDTRKQRIIKEGSYTLSLGPDKPGLPESIEIQIKD